MNYYNKLPLVLFMGSETGTNNRRKSESGSLVQSVFTRFRFRSITGLNSFSITEAGKRQYTRSNFITGSSSRTGKNKR